MNAPTLPRLVLFTLGVLAGATAILTDRFFVPGILLIGFSGIILMSRREQKKHWSTPLTKWQIVRGFIPLVLMLSFITYLFITDEPGRSASSERTVTSVSDIFKTAFVIAVVFMIGQPWLRWYRMRDAAGAPSQSN